MDEVCVAHFQPAPRTGITASPKHREESQGDSRSWPRPEQPSSPTASPSPPPTLAQSPAPAPAPALLQQLPSAPHLARSRSRSTGDAVASCAPVFLAHQQVPHFSGPMDRLPPAHQKRFDVLHADILASLYVAPRRILSISRRAPVISTVIPVGQAGDAQFAEYIRTHAPSGMMRAMGVNCAGMTTIANSLGEWGRIANAPLGEELIQACDGDALVTVHRKGRGTGRVTVHLAATADVPRPVCNICKATSDHFFLKWRPLLRSVLVAVYAVQPQVWTPRATLSLLRRHAPWIPDDVAWLLQKGGLPSMQPAATGSSQPPGRT